MSELTLPLLLQTINRVGLPVGASFLSAQLSIPPATIGRMLRAAEDDGYLRQISNKGRVLTEQGRLFLREADAAALREQAAKDLINTAKSVTPEQLLEILQVRRLLEPYAAAQACMNASAEDVAEIEDLAFEQVFEIHRGGLGSEQDLHLHLKLAKLSGNATVYHILKLLLTEKGVYVQFSSMSEKMKIQKVTQHDDIVSAIKAKNPSGAALAMEQHIDRLIHSEKTYAQLL